MLDACALEHGHPEVLATGEVHDSVVGQQEGQQAHVDLLQEMLLSEVAPKG
jgi:hypothetical protein